MEETIEKEKQYVVVHDFRDLKADNRVYIVGDRYPAEGVRMPKASRIKELLSDTNKMKTALIKEQA